MKPSLLLVHGGPGMDGSYFFPYLNPLGKTAMVHSYLQLQPATLDALCAQLHFEARQLPGPLFILGHSWGGMLLLETLQRYKMERLEGVILVSTGFDPSMNEAFHGCKAKWACRPSSEARTSPDQAMKLQCLESVELFFTKKHCLLGEEVLKKISYNAEAFSQLPYFNTQFDLKPVLSSLNVPVLNIYGEADFRIPACHSKMAENLNQLVQNHEMKDVGHFPFVESPDAFCSTVLKWFESIGE